MQGANLYLAQMQGAILQYTQLQGAKFKGAQMQGARSRTADEIFINLINRLPDFENAILNRAGTPSELDGTVFAGGLGIEQVQQIERDLEPYWGKARLKELIDKLFNTHMGAKSHQPPKGIKPGKYTKAQAETWIKEYKQAMQSVPKKTDPKDI